MSKLNPWLFATTFAFAAACGAEDDKVEEPSSEPSEEVDEPSSEPSIEEPAEVAIDAMGVMFYNGYQANTIAGASIPALGEDPIFGGFTVFLVSQATEEYCILDWDLGADSVQAEASFASGSVPDGFGGPDIETWYGFEITSAPTVRSGYEETCGNMDEFGQQLYDGLSQTTPVFGYGPLGGLSEYVESAAADVSFAGVVGFDFLSQSGRSYFALNQGFAYAMNEDGTTDWDPAGQTYPQGTEIPSADVEYAEGFYVGNAMLSIAWQQ